MSSQSSYRKTSKKDHIFDGLTPEQKDAAEQVSQFFEGKWPLEDIVICLNENNFDIEKVINLKLDGKEEWSVVQKKKEPTRRPKSGPVRSGAARQGSDSEKRRERQNKTPKTTQSQSSTTTDSSTTTSSTTATNLDASAVAQPEIRTFGSGVTDTTTQQVNLSFADMVKSTPKKEVLPAQPQPSANLVQQQQQPTAASSSQPSVDSKPTAATTAPVDESKNRRKTVEQSHQEKVESPKPTTTQPTSTTSSKSSPAPKENLPQPVPQQTVAPQQQPQAHTDTQSTKSQAQQNAELETEQDFLKQAQGLNLKFGTFGISDSGSQHQPQHHQASQQVQQQQQHVAQGHSHHQGMMPQPNQIPVAGWNAYYDPKHVAEMQHAPNYPYFYAQQHHLQQQQQQAQQHLSENDLKYKQEQGNDMKNAQQTGSEGNYQQGSGKYIPPNQQMYSMPNFYMPPNMNYPYMMNIPQFSQGFQPNMPGPYNPNAAATGAKPAYNGNFPKTQQPTGTNQFDQDEYNQKLNQYLWSLTQFQQQLQMQQAQQAQQAQQTQVQPQDKSRIQQQQAQQKKTDAKVQTAMPTQQPQQPQQPQFYNTQWSAFYNTNARK